MTLAERLSQKELLTFDEIAELCYSEAENRACFLTDVLPIRDQSVTAAYVSYAATVFLNMENLEKDSKRMADSFISRKNFKAENEILYRNFYIFTTIFHEIEHACDYYKSFSSQFDEFEEWIYITSGRIRKIKELYEKHAFYFPRERNAEINAWIKALNVFSHTDLTKEELMELQRWIISFVVFGYDQKEGGLYTGPFESL